MVQRKKYTGWHKTHRSSCDFDISMRELDEKLRYAMINELYIIKWYIRRARVPFSRKVLSYSESKLNWRITSAVPNSQIVQENLMKIIRNNPKLPYTKWGLARYLNKLLKKEGLDKTWLIVY